MDGCIGSNLGIDPSYGRSSSSGHRFSTDRSQDNVSWLLPWFEWTSPPSSLHTLTRSGSHDERSVTSTVAIVTLDTRRRHPVLITRPSDVTPDRHPAWQRDCLAATVKDAQFPPSTRAGTVSLCLRPKTGFVRVDGAQWPGVPVILVGASPLWACAPRLTMQCNLDGGGPRSLDPGRQQGP